MNDYALQDHGDLQGTLGAMTPRLVALPILPVRDMAEALEFWSRLPHLTVEQYEGDGYAFVRHLDAEVIHLDHRPLHAGRVHQVAVGADC